MLLLLGTFQVLMWNMLAIGDQSQSIAECYSSWRYRPLPVMKSRKLLDRRIYASILGYQSKIKTAFADFARGCSHDRGSGGCGAHPPALTNPSGKAMLASTGNIAPEDFTAPGRKPYTHVELSACNSQEL